MLWSRGRRGAAAQAGPDAAAHMPDAVTELAREIEQANARLAAQRSAEAEALVTALDEREIAAERTLAVTLRHLDRRRRAKDGEAAAAAADAAREVDVQIKAADHRDILAARKALARQRRASSPHAKLARLDAKRTWTLQGLGGVVAVGMIWSAINVQNNVVHAPAVPLTPGQAMYWSAFVIEAMVSVCLVGLMVGVPALAEWGVKLDKKTVLVAEGALLLLMLGLNTWPYLSPWVLHDVVVHSIAPVMIAVAMQIYHALSGGYALALQRATAAVPADIDLLAEHRAAVGLLGTAGPAALSSAGGLGAEQSSIAATAEPSTAASRATEPSSPVEQSSVSSSRAVEHSARTERFAEVEQSSARHGGEHFEQSSIASGWEVEQPEQSSISASEDFRTEQFARFGANGSGETEPLPEPSAWTGAGQSRHGWSEPEQSGTGAGHSAHSGEQDGQGRASVLSQWSAASAAARGLRTGHPEQVARGHAEQAETGAEVEHSAVLAERSAEQIAEDLEREFAELQAARRRARAAERLGGGESSTDAEQPSMLSSRAIEHAEQSSTEPSGPVEHAEQSSNRAPEVEQSSAREVEHAEPSTEQPSTDAEQSAAAERAAEVAEMAHSRMPLDKVALVLAAADADPSATPSKIARRVGVSFDAARKLIEADAQRSRGGEVIALRKS
ncbi:hypothetical protein ACFROC_22900 [Nocardia tengchongensis]|uniref:hypothetical protein n=1 Tax=Nocardia tengchongensis TaxID=2055889 RepID=UPI0036792962